MRIKTIQPTKQHLKRRLRVCAYVRVSTDSLEQEDSLENQIRFFEDYIKANPDWEYVEVYYDQGISGYIEDRENFQRLLEDARNGRFDLVVVKSVSRFARNTETTLATTRELKALGIGVYFMLQKLNTLESSGELMLTIRGAFAQAEIDSARETTRMAYRRRFEQGIPCTSTRNTYGYIAGEGYDICIFEEEASVVRLIYDLAEMGVWMARIMHYLNKNNIPSPSGAKWDNSAIARVLRNVMYKGDLILQKTYHDERHVTRENRGEVDSWYIQHNHPAIISAEQWQRVNDLLDTRLEQLNAPKPEYHGNTPSTTRYSWSGLLHCPRCGATLQHKWSTNHKGEYWACRTNLKVSAAACKGIWVPFSATKDWDVREPVVVEKYEDEYGMTQYTAYPMSEYSFKEDKHGTSHSTDTSKAKDG